MERLLRKSRRLASQSPGLHSDNQTLAQEPFDLNRLLTHSRYENENYVRALCQNAYLGDKVGLARVLGRYKMLVDTQDMGVSAHLLLDGYWEMWVTIALKALIRPGMIVADIGANLGYYTLIMADLCGPTGGVHAFEPHPYLNGLVRRSLAINGFDGRVWLHQTALGRTEGQEMLFIVNPSDPKNSHISSLETAHYHRPNMEQSVIKTRRLDSEEAWHSIELAKIDAEGAEELIWDGAEGLLQGSKLRTIVLEFTPARYADPYAFLDRITSHGFSLSIIDPDLGAQPATPDEICFGPGDEDVMLLLQR